MSKVIALGGDFGNTSVKIKTSKDSYRIDTLVKKPMEARRIFDRGDMGDAINFLDVDIESQDVSGNYYIGGLASGDGSQESIGGLKCENKILKVASLTSMAYVLATEYLDNEFEVALGTGLPVREFFMKNSEGKVDFANVEKYQKMFVGEHTITFNTKLLENRKIRIIIDDQKLNILPECYAGLLTVVTDQNGLTKPEYAKNYINVLGADLGGGSSDFAGFCNENYINECMFGFDIGINEAQDRLCEDIATMAKLRNFNRHDLNTYLFDPELHGVLETNKGGTFDLNELKKQYYSPLVDKITYSFKKALNKNGFDINLANYLFLMGGASKEIGTAVCKELSKEIKNVQVVTEPITRNVEAYYNTAKEYENNGDIE